MGADAGLTGPKLDAIPDGPASAVWTSLERTLLTAVDEMVDEHVVSDETWGGLVSAFAAQIFELLFVVGGCLCLAAVLNSVGLQAAIRAPGDDPVTPGGDAAELRPRRLAPPLTVGPTPGTRPSPASSPRLTSSLRGPLGLRW